ncbi:hippocampus abundant transcript-like protein 1 [Drosophila santomea]|uniref:hippocampus abundant transcript-like protein 1 n=1 Tax=Drosophila santomea TaxID=129105 RepID=UPI0019542111|nr:hippocampus abundant transcript-like protein 1 [Drosophila santomea]
MAQLKFLRPLVKLLVNRPGIGKASVWHAVIVTFMHYFSWGLLTVPFIEKLSLSFGNHVLLADGLVYGVRGILGFVTTPVMGAISDFRGRKVVMLLAVATTYAPIPFMMLKSWWFFAILTVSSICGNTYSASLAYVADVTSVEHRSKGYGIVAASFGAGIAFSPSLGNYLMKSFGSGAVILIATITGLINILFIIYAVPESLVLKEKKVMLDEINDNQVDDKNVDLHSKEKKEILNGKQKLNDNVLANKSNHNPSQNLVSNKEQNQEINKEEENVQNDVTEMEKSDNGTLNTSDLWEGLRKSRKDKNLLVIYLIIFLSIWPFAGVDSTAPVYLKTNMGFEYEEVSMMLGLLSVLAITSNLLLGYIMNIVGAKWSIRLGLLLLLSQLLFLVFGTHHWMYWLSSILAAMATIIPAASNAVASIYASPENLGAVLGIISGIECLSEGLGPAFFGVLFFIFQDDSENNLKVNSPIPMPFVISAIAVFVAIVLTGFIKMETVEKEPLIYKISDDATEDELEPLTTTTFEDENIFGYVKLEIDDYYDSDCRERSFK